MNLGLTVSGRLFIALLAGMSLVGTTSAFDVKPDSLLSVDQNRSTVVDRVHAAWGDALEKSNGGISKEQLREMLMGLRADHLLAASLSGSLEGLRDVLAKSVLPESPVRRDSVDVKALGDANRDLVYTPLAPCRILDTRNAGGALLANVSRNFVGFSANFDSQGGTAGTCSIPNGVAALAMNVYAVNATGLGFIKVWPQAGAEPAVSTVNYQNGFIAIATGAIVPVNAANNNSFTAKSPLNIDFIADVVGYFAAPAGYAAPTKVTHSTSSTAATTDILTICTNYAGGQISVTAPVAGRIVVRSTAWVQNFHTTGTTDNANITIGATVSDCGGAFGFLVRPETPSALPSATYQWWASPFREFVVAAGTYTYYLNGSASAVGKARFWFAAMEATFFPN
jgi:hypothetical protein